MTEKKSGKNVAGMAVLQDIRNLLSTSPETKKVPVSEAETGKAPRKGKVESQKELKQYQEKITLQQTLITRLEKEKQELSAKLDSLQLNKTAEPKVNRQVVADVADLEARKEELSLALSHIEDILQLKTRDLVRRISRIYEEAGDFDAGRDFRRISNQMEAAENFGEFVRALLRD